MRVFTVQIRIRGVCKCVKMVYNLIAALSSRYSTMDEHSTYTFIDKNCLETTNIMFPPTVVHLSPWGVRALARGFGIFTSVQLDLSHSPHTRPCESLPPSYFRPSLALKQTIPRSHHCLHRKFSPGPGAGATAIIARILRVTLLDMVV